jgi:hypothetical protein
MQYVGEGLQAFVKITNIIGVSKLRNTCSAGLVARIGEIIICVKQISVLICRYLCKLDKCFFETLTVGHFCDLFSWHTMTYCVAINTISSHHIKANY